MSPNEGAHPLEYRCPEPDRRRISWWQVAAGVVAGPVMMYAFLIGGMFIGIYGAGSGGMFEIVAIVGLAALTAAGLIAAWAVAAEQHESRRGLAIGLWIGLGMAILLFGACLVSAFK